MAIGPRSTIQSASRPLRSRAQVSRACCWDSPRFSRISTITATIISGKRSREPTSTTPGESRPKLTIGAGLRWDYWTPYHEKYNRIDNIDLASVTGNQMQVVLPGNTKLSDIPGIPAGVIISWAARGLTSFRPTRCTSRARCSPRSITTSVRAYRSLTSSAKNGCYAEAMASIIGPCRFPKFWTSRASMRPESAILE